MSFSFCDLWLMDRAALDLHLRLMNRLADNPAIVAEIRESRKPSVTNRVAVVPVHGPIEGRPSELGRLLGMTSAAEIGNVFNHYVADESIGTIVLDIDSPGGMVSGTPELARTIYAARERKTIIASVNYLAASGAYWIAAAAHRIVGSATSFVGSVGVVIHHIDDSKARESEGINETVIRSSDSPYKQDVSSGEPLTEGAREYLQSQADAIYGQFAGDLAKFRGVSVQHVNEHFGKGRMFLADDGLRAGMVDRIDTHSGTLSKVLSGRLKIGATASADDWDAPTDAERFRMRVRERQASLAAMVGEN